MENGRNCDPRFFFVCTQFGQWFHKYLQSNVRSDFGQRKVKETGEKLGAKPNVVEIIEHRKNWEDIWWLLAENDVVKYNEVRKLEVVQFFTFLEKWKEMIEKKMKQIKHQ